MGLGTLLLLSSVLAAEPTFNQEYKQRAHSFCEEYADHKGNQNGVVNSDQLVQYIIHGQEEVVQSSEREFAAWCQNEHFYFPVGVEVEGDNKIAFVPSKALRLKKVSGQEIREEVASITLLFQIGMFTGNPTGYIEVSGGNPVNLFYGNPSRTTDSFGLVYGTE